MLKRVGENRRPGRTPTVCYCSVVLALLQVAILGKCATMKKYNISTNLIQVIKNLYNKATSAVLFSSSIGDWFRTTVGVRQGCLLSPTLFNIFLERNMTDALEDHEGTVSTGGRTTQISALLMASMA